MSKDIKVLQILANLGCMLQNIVRISLSPKTVLTLHESVRKAQYLKIAFFEGLLLITTLIAVLFLHEISFVLFLAIAVAGGIGYCLWLQYISQTGKTQEVYAACVSAEPVYTGIGSGVVSKINRKSLQIYRFITNTDAGEEVSIYIHRTKNLGFHVGGLYFLLFHSDGNELSGDNLIGSLMIQKKLEVENDAPSTDAETDTSAQERKKRISTLHSNEKIKKEE